MFRKKQNVNLASDPNVKAVTFTGSLQEMNPPNYEVVIEYKDGTKSERGYMSSYSLYDQYLPFIPKEYAKEIKRDVENIRAMQKKLSPK